MAPPRSPRKSISDLFPNLNMTSSSAPPHITRLNILRSLRQTLRQKFPHWGSIRGTDIRVQFTIRQDAVYSWLNDDDDPEDIFAKTHGFFEEVQNMMGAISAAQEKAYDEFMVNALSEMIFGSNLIERAGAAFDITLNICKEIFMGNEVSAEIEERHPDYAAQRKHLVENSMADNSQAVIRSRREIVQHALALKHITVHMVIHNELLTEELILATHKILCDSIEAPDGYSSEKYAGKYRTESVTAGFNAFTPAKYVPFAMQRLVADFNRDISRAEEDRSLDPFALASKYCHRFVNIHPFIDGNGRICRLILNAILLKYSGVVIALGEKESERTEYLEITVKATEEEHVDEDERQKPAYSSLATLVIMKAVGAMGTLREKLRNA